MLDDPWRTLGVASKEKNSPLRIGNIRVPTYEHSLLRHDSY